MCLRVKEAGAQDRFTAPRSQPSLMTHVAMGVRKLRVKASKKEFGREFARRQSHIDQHRIEKLFGGTE